MITAWRLVKKRRAANAFDGQGARLYGGRWNHPGLSVVYLSDSLALAALEQFIHLGPEGVGLAYVYFRVGIPKAVKVEALGSKNLPAQWRQEPPNHNSKDLGSNWLQRGNAALLRVPSALMPLEGGFNFLVNPRHPDFGKLKLEGPHPFSFDPRMSK